MSTLTILGDVSILDKKITSTYKIDNEFIFNLECVVTSNLKQPKPQKVNLYSKDIYINEIFGHSPIAVNIANNHILDYGKVGYLDTVDYLKRNNIKYFGVGTKQDNFNNPLYIEVKKNRVALLGYSLFEEECEDISSAKLQIEQIERDILSVC